MTVKSVFSVASLCTVLLLSLIATPGYARNDRDNNDHRGSYERVRNNYYNRTNNNYRRPEVVTRYVPAPRYTPPRPVYFNNYYFPPAYSNHHRYYVGERLTTYYPVPQPVLVRLQPAPYGHYYSMYDNNNILLVSQRDNTIVQILSLLLQ